MINISLNEYNKYHYGENRNKYVSYDTSWVLSPTNDHHERVLVFWNKDSDRLACFSAVWPHNGCQEYSDKIHFEHWPWDPPDDLYGWVYIGWL